MFGKDSTLKKGLKKMGVSETDAAMMAAGLAVAGGVAATAAANLDNKVRRAMQQDGKRTPSNDGSDTYTDIVNSKNNNYNRTMTTSTSDGPPTCWLGCSAPKQSSCITQTGKVILFPFAGIAYILGGLTRIADNVIMCVCWPCFFDFLVYEGSDEATLNDAQHSGNCKVQCYKCWKSGRRLNGDFYGMESCLETCFMPGMAPTCCCSCCKTTPQYGEDLEGHCLDAPYQLCLMDVHRSF